MLKQPLPGIRFAAPAAAALHSAGAWASFNSFGNGPLCRDVACAFFIGNAIGIAGGIPVSMVVFWVLGLVFRGAQKPGERRGAWIFLHGTIAYELAAHWILLASPNTGLAGLLIYLAYAALALVFWRRPRAKRGRARRWR